RRLGLRFACLATGAEPTDRDDSIAEVTDLREVQADLGERLVDVANPLADAIVSPIHRRPTFEQGLKRPVPLHLPVDFLEEPVDIPAVVCLNRSLERLNVLLRHRPGLVPLAEGSRPTRAAPRPRGRRPDSCSCESGRSCLSAARPAW